MPGRVTPPRRRRRAWRIALAVATLILLPLAATAGWTLWDWRRIVMAWTDQAEAGDLIVLDQTLSAIAAAPSCLTCATAAGLFRDWLATRGPPPGSPVVQAEEIRRAPYGGCNPAMAGVAAARVALSDAVGAAVKVSAGLCRVRYVVSGAPSVALVMASPALRQTTESVATGADEAAVTLDLPPLFIYATEQRIVALAARVPVDKTLAWLRPQIPPAPAPLPEALVARLASLGVVVRVVRHRIDPDRGM